MNVEYSDRTKQTEEHFELLLQATARLKETLSAAQDSVRARWDRIEDERGCPLYSLKLSDFSGEVEAAFTPDDLRKGDSLREADMRFRLARLCGELMRIRSHKLMEALREPFDTEVDWYASKPE
ncbi:MAG: hypothetical protein ACRELG_09755 [Gemmataceae bacterium]